MCVHIYYAYSILSNFQEKLETLVKFKMGYSYSSSNNCLGLHAHKEKNCTHTYKHINLHTYTHTQKVFFLAFVYRLLEIFTQKKHSLCFTHECIQIQSNLHTHFDFYNANVASRDLQRNASFQPTDLHHLAMLFIFEKIKRAINNFLICLLISQICAK